MRNSGNRAAGKFNNRQSSGGTAVLDLPENELETGPDTDQALLEADRNGQLAAINKSQAVIEFELDGTIIKANDNFLSALGYRLEEIQGKHHSLFVDPAYAGSPEYRQFWATLNEGKFQAGQFKRIGKGGKEVWIQASYNPIFDGSGKPFKVVKYATDVTAERLRNADYEGQLAAIGKAQAVIEFNLDGTIITANDNFLNTLGYRLDEIKGKHHSTFVDTAYAASNEYKQFWADLRSGKYQAGQFMRVGKGGKEVWIQASYNPIFDLSGKPFKVVKYATDITADKLRNADYEGQLAAIGKSQAVIEFNLDGTIITANDNFLNTLGYRLDEVKGKHHSLFVEPTYGASGEYRQFWADLRSGKFQAAQYKRIGKGGKEVWIQASYNPIFDMNGRPFKVVKYATDITGERAKVDAILKAVDSAAKGDLTQEVTVRGTDALGRIGEGMSNFFIQLRKTIGQIGQNATSLASSSEELSSVSTQMSANAEETSAQANVVSAASEQVSKNVQTVATAAEEMTASIKEIAKNAAESAKVATTAVKVAEKTNTTVAKLGESSVEIGKVIKVITSIAQQTNLLALNATIEAARAGEAGKGFAVVANEVKELAKETAKATEDISQKIEAIRSDTKESVDAIAQIGKIINQINDISNTIASAVEEQTATTNEMTRNISEAAKGSSEIAQNITGVATAAKSTTEGATNTSKAATELSRMSSELQTVVGQFKV
jgi:methyl-accepting chemotaxis protein